MGSPRQDRAACGLGRLADLFLAGLTFGLAFPPRRATRRVAEETTLHEKMGEPWAAGGSAPPGKQKVAIDGGSGTPGGYA